MNQKNFILIAGCPRSGTYLLASLLTKHFNIVFPLETHIFYLLRNRIHLWGDLKFYENRKHLLTDIYSFLEVWLYKGMKLDKKALPYSLLSTKKKSENILRNSTNFESLIHNLYSEYAKNHLAEYYGDKSVPFWHIPLEEIQRLIPNLKVIHLIRDGRDVHLSWQKTWFGSSCLYESARVWAEHLNLKRNWGEKNPEKYLELKYEDLLSHTDVEIEKISKFLKLNKTTTALTPHFSGIANLYAGKGHHDLLSGDVVKNNFKKWKKSMDPKDRMFFEYIAGDILNKFKYEVDNKKVSLADCIRFNLLILFSKFLIFFSINNFKRRIKSILPIILFYARKFRIVSGKNKFFR